VKYLSIAARQMMFCPKTKLALPKLVLHSKSSQQMALNVVLRNAYFWGKLTEENPV